MMIFSDQDLSEIEAGSTWLNLELKWVCIRNSGEGPEAVVEDRC